MQLPSGSQPFWKRAFRVVRNAVRNAGHWLGQRELPVLIGLLVILLACWGFAEVADDALEGETRGFDEWAVRIFRQADDPGRALGPLWVTEVARDFTALGGMAVLTLLTLVISGFLMLRQMTAAAILLLISTVGGVVLNVLLKELFDRPRPDVVPHLMHAASSSFPSGHSMMSATVFLTLGVLLSRFVEQMPLRAYIMAVALMLTFCVGFSRVFLGVHYPTDVLAGWIAGLAWAVLCWLVASALQRKGLIERAAEEPHLPSD